MYQKIGPTAWGVAFARAQADIPYAPEIFAELDAVIHPTDPLEVEYLRHAKESKIAPQFEARYKLINRLLRKERPMQILEIASGLAPRGLEMSKENPQLCYVEVDLPEMASYKRDILENLFRKEELKKPKNLFIEDGDALDLNSLVSAARHFTEKPLAILHEGLLRYMNFEQKKIIANNIHKLLEKFGGVWITSDITLLKNLGHLEERRRNRELVKLISGINVEENAFANIPAAEEFFENLGFTIEQHSFLEMKDSLVTPKKLGISPQEMNQFLENAVVFVMRLK